MGLLDGWAHCPRCANELTRLNNAVECSSCGFLLYGHSAVTASALPLDDERRVLLARRGFEPFLGLWDAVGEPRELLGIWMGRYADDRATLNLFWTGRLADGTPRAADDVAELRWFAGDELPPPEELAFDGLVADVLAAWRKKHP
jgi:ADP-ribose pyrophosphatase YjhB (NUDIX family)